MQVFMLHLLSILRTFKRHFFNNCTESISLSFYLFEKRAMQRRCRCFCTAKLGCNGCLRQLFTWANSLSHMPPL